MLSLFLSAATAITDLDELIALLEALENPDAGKRAARTDNNDEGGSTLVVPRQLGTAYDMTQFDVWNMVNLGSDKHVLEWGEFSGADEFPLECLQDSTGTDQGCSTSIVVDITEFSSSTEAVDAWTNTFSLGASASGGGYGGNLNMAYSASGSGTYASVKSGALAESTAHNGCTRILASCLAPGTTRPSPLKLRQHYLDEIAHAAENYLDTDGKNEYAMRFWQNNIIEQFGTDIAIGLDHGSSIRQTSTNDQNGLDYAFASSFDICAGFQASVIPGAQAASATAPATKAAADATPASGRRRVAAPVPVKANVTMCTGGSRDNTINTDETNFERQCTTVGGGGSPALRSKLCQIPMTATPDEVAEFLNSGFERNSGNVINMKTLSLPNLWWQLNSREAKSAEIHATYLKAIEYHKCLAQNSGSVHAVREWNFETGTCGCTRTCNNHGVVDPETCTCLCFGDALHGYKGENCGTAYGKCRPNANAGDPGQASKCSSIIDGKPNFCKARHRNIGEQCDAGQTCCTTYYSGTCCPYGYTCGHRRYWKRPLNEKWANGGQQIYAGCSSGACDVCIPPQSRWNGVNYNSGIQLSTLFPSGTKLPSPLQSISHESWTEMSYGKISSLGRGEFDEDYRAGKQNREVNDDVDDLESRLARLVEALEELDEGI